MKKDSFGKPYIESDNFYFNASHTQNLIMIAVSYQQPLGIDIENIEKNFLEIMPITFTDKEINVVNNLNYTQKLLAFFIIWTRKEAITKEIGIGLLYDFQGLDVSDVSLKKLLKTDGNYYITYTFLSNYIFSISASNKFKINKIQKMNI